MDKVSLFIIISSILYIISYIVRIWAMKKYKTNKRISYILLKLFPFIYLILVFFSPHLNKELFNIDFFNIIALLDVNPIILSVLTFIGELIIEIKVK